MILIFGGAYEGMLEYAAKHYNIDAEDVFRCNGEQAELDLSFRAIEGFHRLVLAHVRNDVDTLEYIRLNMPMLEDKIIISEDISCGIVPVDPVMRLWREQSGRSLTCLTAAADEVVRVFCGIGTRLK